MEPFVEKLNMDQNDGNDICKNKAMVEQISSEECYTHMVQKTI